MPFKRIKHFNHSLRKTIHPFFFLFIPWSILTQNKEYSWTDNSKIQIGYSFKKDCSLIYKKQIAEVAFTERVKEKGLSYRKKPIKTNESMFFFYPSPRILTFWMKETFFPLQIAFFNTQGELLNTQEMQIEENPSHPKNFYSSFLPAEVAIEMNPKQMELNSLKKQKKKSTYALKNKFSFFLI